MNSLRDIFLELSLDPFAQDAWQRDSEAYLDAAEVAPAERGLLRGEQRDALAAALDTGAWSPSAIMWDPGPDPLPDVSAEAVPA